MLLLWLPLACDRPALPDDSVPPVEDSDDVDAEVCDDDVDNDADGDMDCGDRDCWGPGCAEVCSGGKDEDGDGLVDCRDDDCDVPCVEDCWRRGDEDVDGAEDCNDPDCANQLPCGEVCDNGRDDDGDALVDCEDGDCAAVVPCVEGCDNHEDDDDDGLTDCWDDDCWGPDCVGATAAAVQSGEMRGTRKLVTWNTLSWGSSLTDMRYVGDVRGVLRVADGYGGTARTCSWSVSSVRLRSHVLMSVGSSGGPDPLHRDGARAAADCSVGGDFLPPLLVASSDGVALPRRRLGSPGILLEPGTPWYAGTGRRTTFHYVECWDGTSVGGRCTAWTRTDWTGLTPTPGWFYAGP